MSKPTLVLVPGGFTRATLYDGFIDKLRENGYEAETVDLPSTMRRDPLPAATVQDDALAIQAVVSKYIDQGKDVHLHTHSYGGVPGTESIKDVAKATREAKGLKGGVSRIVYTTSVILAVGQTLKNDDMGDDMPDFITVDGDYMLNDPEIAVEMTFSDLPPAEALTWAKKTSVQSIATLTSPLSYPGYRDVDLSYIVCVQDLAVPMIAQNRMIELLRQESGKPVDVHYVHSGHAPHITRPALLFDIVKKITDGAT